MRRLILLIATLTLCFTACEDTEPATTDDTSVSTTADATTEDDTSVATDATTQEDATREPDAEDDTPATPDPDALWAEMMALDGVHWVYRARDAFVDGEGTQRAQSGDAVLFLQPSGNNIPTVSGLEFKPSLDYAEEQVWYASYGSSPTYVDRGGGDEYVRFVNGLASNFESEPGQLSPAEAMGEDFHLVYCFRTQPGASYEAPMTGITWKDRFGNGNQIGLLFPGEADAFGPDGVTTVWGQDNIVEIRISANGDVDFWLNGTSIIQTSASSLLTDGLKEWTIGTNSHVMANHFRAMFIKRGAHFNESELATLYTNTDALWPRGVFPTYPYLEGQFSNRGRHFDSTTKTWAPPTGTFSGGNGVEGEHLYQWYYYRKDDPAFRIANKLDSHLPIPGATGPTLTRTDYEAGNADGNPVLFENPGDSSVSVMRVVTPRDSDGTEGETLAGEWAPDNIP